MEGKIVMNVVSWRPVGRVVHVAIIVGSGNGNRIEAFDMMVVIGIMAWTSPANNELSRLKMRDFIAFLNTFNVSKQFDKQDVILLSRSSFAVISRGCFKLNSFKSNDGLARTHGV